jgi:hypothetical protein
MHIARSNAGSSQSSDTRPRSAHLPAGAIPLPGPRLEVLSGRPQHSALEEDHLQDQCCNCGERECYQALENPDCHLPPALLADFVFSTPLQFVELVGLCHVASP